MNCTCNHISVYKKMGRTDPTNTFTLRRMFEKALIRRFKKLSQLITKVIVEDDVFGLTNTPMVQASPGRQAFNFPRSGDRVAAFMQWLNQQVSDGVLEIGNMSQIGSGVEGAWTNMYVTDSYKRGVQRARYEMNKAGFDVPKIGDSGGMNAVMNAPFHIDRVGLLYTRVFNELKGITDTMSIQMNKVLAQGMIDGDGPRMLARKMNAVIKGGGADLSMTDILGRFIPAERRARMLAQTEMIRAHHIATVQEYKNWGTVGVKVKAEWSTSGDGRVCEQCSSLEGKVYTLDEIERIIPRHPNCLIDKQIPIYTSEGWKPIGNIRVGDLVLTHKGQFKKVIKLHRTKKQTPNVVSIFVNGMKNKKITVTDNHPILIGDVWKAAGDVLITDKVTVLANRCKRCNKLIPYWNEYCSQSCVSLDNSGQFEFISVPITKIDKWVVKQPKTLYNLSVECDESYIAKGMVIHNCRCLALPTMPEKETKPSSNMDAVSKNFINQKDAEKYIQYKTEYNRVYGSFTDDQIKAYQQGLSNVVDDFHMTIYNKNIRDTIYSWQKETHGNQPMKLRWVASKVEKNMKMTFPETWDNNQIMSFIENVGKSQVGITTDDYIKIRALNQAYMERIGVNSIELHRGTDGAIGKDLLKIVRELKENKSTNTIRITDFNLCGYSSNINIASNFVEDGNGIGITKNIDINKILIHKDLFGRYGNFKHLKEFEFVVIGEDVVLDLSKIWYFL